MKTLININWPELLTKTAIPLAILMTSCSNDNNKFMPCNCIGGGQYIGDHYKKVFEKIENVDYKAAEKYALQNIVQLKNAPKLGMYIMHVEANAINKNLDQINLQKVDEISDYRLWTKQEPGLIQEAISLENKLSDMLASGIPIIEIYIEIFDPGTDYSNPQYFTIHNLISYPDFELINGEPIYGTSHNFPCGSNSLPCVLNNNDSLPLKSTIKSAKDTSLKSKISDLSMNDSLHDEQLSINIEVNSTRIATVRRAFFYNSPEIASRLKSYIIAGQEVSVQEESGDFIFVAFANGKTITKGWMLKSDFDITSSKIIENSFEIKDTLNLTGRNILKSKRNIGMGFDLTGRNMRIKPRLEESSQETGTVVIDVVIDKDGNVTSVNGPGRGSTISAPVLVNKVKKAAYEAKFSKSDSGVEEQRGTITFIFTN